ncbi:glycosyltransferase family 4 protein [Listeria grandensis]|nr:glycosyltransferase family 4 protein [Listeria grandensis]
MKKILIISQNFYPEIGSAANRTKFLFQKLSERNQVTLITTDPRYPNQNLYKQDDFWEEALDETRVIRVKPRTKKYANNILKRFLFYLEVMLQFIRAIVGQGKDTDTVYISTPPISVGVAGLFAKRFLKARLIVEVRDLWPETLIGVKRWNNRFFLGFAYWLENKIYHQADEIVVNSEGFVDYIIAKGISKQKIHFIPNSLTEAEFECSATQNRVNDKETKTIIYTGNVGLAQEMDGFFELAARFKANEAITFKIIGYGFKLQEIKQRLQQYQLTNVTILPPQKRSQVLQEIGKADVAYVTLVDHPIFEKVIPGKIIDYMGMGVPIIGNVSGYSSCVIEKANCGYTFQHNQIDEMYQKVKELVENPEMAQRIGCNGYQYAYQHHRWQQNFKKMEGIIDCGK